MRFGRGRKDGAMNDDPLSVDDAFFGALVRGDAEHLERVLHRDFIIVDVMRGGRTDRQGFLDAVSSGQVTFDRIDPTERLVRRYDGTAVVVGRTSMAGSAAGRPFAAASRYTHVFVEDGGATWRLASAQGTPIVEDAGPVAEDPHTSSERSERIP